MLGWKSTLSKYAKEVGILIIWKHYKETHIEAKRVMRDVKPKAYDNLYNELWPKGTEVKVYKLVKLREKKNKELKDVRCIKNIEDNLLMRVEELYIF